MVCCNGSGDERSLGDAVAHGLVAPQRVVSTCPLEAVMGHIKLACAAIIFMSIVSGALAQSRPLTLRMSCNGARQLVAARGAIVLNTGPTTYDRYVAGNGQCALGEVIDPAWVPTADNPQCPIGYRCVSRTLRSGG